MSRAEESVTDFLALVSDKQKEDIFFGVLICRGLVRGRLHWYLLGLGDRPLVQGSVDCAEEFSSQEARFEFVKEAVAGALGIDPQHIKPVEGSEGSLPPLTLAPFPE